MFGSGSYLKIHVHNLEFLPHTERGALKTAHIFGDFTASLRDISANIFGTKRAVDKKIAKGP